MINRMRGMPPGYTTRDMAADYAAVLEQELGPSHIMGFSTGGDIAQYVAIDYPASVRSLALVVSACRLSEEGREICERWQTLAREERWRELRADMASVNVPARRTRAWPGRSWRSSGGSSSRYHPTRRISSPR